MSFLTDVGTSVAVDGAGRVLARTRDAVGAWARGYLRWGNAVRESEARAEQMRQALLNAAAVLERAGDHLLQLDQAGAPFDPQKVLIEAHTKGLFKLPQPLITASVRDTNTLHINCGRRHGVVAGVSLSIVSKDGRFQTRHVLRDADIREDHVCVCPPRLDLRTLTADDLIVSFAQVAELSPGERALSLLLDETMSAAAQIKSVLATAQS